MANFQQGFTSQAPQTKDELRKMLADALRNTHHIDTVRVPANKRSLPSRQRDVAVPETSEPVVTPAKQPTKGQKRRG
jgi:hypothetical protein